jgi:hypothetical protein
MNHLLVTKRRSKYQRHSHGYQVLLQDYCCSCANLIYKFISIEIAGASWSMIE